MALIEMPRHGIRSTTYLSYALNLAQLGRFAFQIFVQQSRFQIIIPVSGHAKQVLTGSSLFKNGTGRNSHGSVLVLITFVHDKKR
ncbi:hypothetical protein [Acinetobacter haemolyticus]|uniref:hypothetical protein n=1 Tax=Acinetobacter haemolyticus TaxID=29430 RepID=UPI0013595667|nr:hypothetical protein [Acinetobacter haemolyticus]